MMKMRWLTGLLVGALLLGSCGAPKQEGEVSAKMQKKKPGVKVMVLKPQPIASKIRVTGTIDSRMRTWVTAPAEGTVLSLDVREGSFVSAGSIIGSIMSADQQNMLAYAQAEYDRAQQSADADPSSMEAAKARLDAARSLYKSFPLVCPIAGTILTKSVEQGANVALRQQLVEVVDLSQLIVRSAVPERYLPSVKVGRKVKVLLPGGDSPVEGVINLVYPSVDVRTRTIGVEIALGTRKNLRPGMSTVVEFVVASHPFALAIPHDALLVKPNGDKIVFIVKDGAAVANRVETGIETNDLVQILSGLNAGDAVVVAGNEALKDGMMVTVSPPKSAPAGKNGGSKR